MTWRWRSARAGSRRISCRRSRWHASRDSSRLPSRARTAAASSNSPSTASWCRRSASTESRRRTSRSITSCGTSCTSRSERTMSSRQLGGGLHLPSEASPQGSVAPAKPDREAEVAPSAAGRRRRARSPQDGSAAGPAEFSMSCPMPFVDTDRILLGHGSGGRLTADLIARCFLPAFRNPYLDRLDDQAVVEAGGARLAFTTDSYVVTPLFFPGGDIGRLAINGTVNDLAIAGARPLFLSAAFI